jgi:hypothetical protein
MDERRRESFSELGTCHSLNESVSARNKMPSLAGGRLAWNHSGSTDHSGEPHELGETRVLNT